jgi:hypothetical protein
MWAKLKQWGLAIASLLLVVLGAGWLWRRYKGELGRVKDKLAVKEALTKVAELRATRAQIVERVGEQDEAIEGLDNRITEQKRRVVRAHELGSSVPEDQIADAFEKAGY